MKRSPLRARRRLRARKGLVRGVRLKQQQRLRAVNPERKARLDLVQVGGKDYRDWLVVGRRCVTCSEPATDASHIHGKGAGGRWYDQVPQCHGCHIGGIHAKGIHTFAAGKGTSLDELLDLAHGFADKYIAEHGQAPSGLPLPPWRAEDCCLLGVAGGVPATTADLYAAAVEASLDVEETGGAS